MSAERVDALAAQLLRAYDAAALLPLPSAGAQPFTLADAYAVGERLRALRVARGEQPVGWKIGFTNRSLWQRYRVHQPIWAPVYDRTLERLDAPQARLSLRPFCQPRVEPEIAFGLQAAPRAGMTLTELRGCIGWVAHAFEIVHTHFEGWRFTAPDTEADFALHGRLIVGPRVDAAAWGDALAADLSALQLELACDGQVKDRGQGSVVLDGPLQALQALVESMAASTPAWRVQADDVVTTGTLTDAWPIAPGQRWSTQLSDPRLAGLTLHTDA